MGSRIDPRAMRADMDPDTALTLFDRAAKLLVRGLPDHSDFGIDFAEWETGPRFQGLKFIPPGLHLVHYRPGKLSGEHRRASESMLGGDLEFRLGFFHHFQEGETLVCEWDAANEELVLEPALDPDQVSRYKLAIREFDPHLGTYPINETADKWRRLTHLITPQLLCRAIPPPPRYAGKDLYLISATCESNLDAIPQRGGARQAPSSAVVPASTENEPRLFFADFDLKRSWDTTAASAGKLTPAQITQHSLDKSWLLGHVLGNRPGDLLAEVQLAFVCLLVAHNFAGFEQWKRIMHLVCQSHDAVEERPDFFVDFLSVLKIQLEECPADFFVDALASGNFIHHLLVELMESIHEAEDRVSPRLETAMDTLTEFVHQRFGMDLRASLNHRLAGGRGLGTLGYSGADSEDDDDLPVLVEL
ncbi:hypothetical protein H9P43_000440 [Blastocladiella emersonii ATCC 22665]|nr:hypothetical protein H9P43_000440 [Blastocladiella emersonii ATCC 22665]